MLSVDDDHEKDGEGVQLCDSDSTWSAEKLLASSAQLFSCVHKCTCAHLVMCRLLSSGSGSLSASVSPLKIFPQEEPARLSWPCPWFLFCFVLVFICLQWVFSLLAWLGRGPFARAAASGTCTESLPHTLVVFIRCLSVGVGECNGFLRFCPFAFLPRTGCLSVPCRVLCLPCCVSAPFSVATYISTPLTASGVLPFLCSVGSLPGPVLSPLDSGVLSPIWHLHSQGKQPFQTYTPKTELLSFPLGFQARSLGASLISTSYLKPYIQSSGKSCDSGHPASWWEHQVLRLDLNNTKSTQILLMILSGGEFDGVCEVNVLGS